MNQDKIRAYYTNNTTVGFHTGNGTTDSIIDPNLAEKHPIITKNYLRKVPNEDWYETYIRMNPNGYNGGYIMDRYSDFNRVTSAVFDEIGAENFKWNRLDLSFNTLDDRYYEDYEKLNRLLIACFAYAEKDHNTFDTKEFWSGRTRSLCTKNRNRAVEFYDKKDESRGKSPYAARLELRSFNIAGDLETEFTKIWFQRLDSALEQFAHVQDKFNQHMSEIFLEDLKIPKRKRDFLSVASFLMTRRKYIFSNRQMKNLLMLIGLDEKRAANCAYNFKKQHDIEYFKKEDLAAMVDDIKLKIAEYFSK